MADAELIRVSENKFRYPRPQFLHKRAYALESATNPISGTAHTLLHDAISNILGRASVPGSAAQIFPVGLLTPSIRYAAAQLSVTAPSLYQDYDRLKSEGELRVVIVPPLLALAVVAPLNGKAWIILAVLVACAVLLVQSISQQRAANDILANAAYLDQVSLPTVQAVVETLKSLSESPTSNGEWMGALVVALEKRGFFDEARAAVRMMVEREVDDIEAAIFYLKEHDWHHFNSLLALIKGSDSPALQAVLERIEITLSLT
ncbi:hypothetical protein AB0C41_22995 [Micromonospora taraxaci]|uniref:hypothetical protein n=1 Tax=Micromonospora taraxaci TaxID=1316803 RepID=UPI0033FEBF4C